MNGSPVSVIVPVFNGERYLEATLKSVFAQDYRPLEVIVVDDGSTDGTAGIARAFPQVRYCHQSNQGVAAARNAGVAAARAEFVAFLDADDLWAPNKLRVQMAFLLEHPEVGYVTAEGQNFLESGANLPAWLPRDIFEKKAGFLPSTLLTRKSAFYEVGEFDPTYKVGEDTEWFARAIDAQVPYSIVAETLLYRRIHENNLSSQTHLNRETLLKVAKRSIEHRRHREVADRANGGRSQNG